MSSKISQARRSNRLYCTVNMQYDNNWRDFTLQRGHVYGWSPEIAKEPGLDGHFVVYREMLNSIILYCSSAERDSYVWNRYAIEKDSLTAKSILEILPSRASVQFRPLDEQNTTALYNPRLTTEKFTPMPRMRIPMGTYKTVYAAKHDFGGMWNPPKHIDIICANIEHRRERERRQRAVS